MFPLILSGICNAGQISGTAYGDGAPIDGTVDLLWVNLAVGDPCGQHDVITTVQVQADGRYRFEGLSDGEYHLYADTYDNSDFTSEWWAGSGSTYYCYNAEPVIISSGSPATGTDFQLETGGAISGTVTSRGQPLAEVCISAFVDRCWRTYMNNAVTDGSGNYRIRGLPTGTYFLHIDSNCINPKNYIAEWYDDISEDYCDGATPVSVTAPGETAGIDVTLEAGFPMDAQLMNVHRPDGSFYTYYSVIPHDFAGPLPGGIDAVTVTPPGGTAMALAWDPEWNEYFAIKDGSPAPGVYTFTAAAGGVAVTETDFQYQVRTIPQPDTAFFSPGPGAGVDGKTPTFTWRGVDVPGIALYYRFEVVDDATGMRAWASGRAKDMFHCTVPAGKLLPDRTYRWRVRVTDSDNFIKVQNRANSAWQSFTTAPVLADHSAVPAIHLDSFGTGTYRTGDRVNLEHWIKVVDHDGVAFDHTTDTPSHTVTVTYPDSSVHPLHYLWSDGPHSAYYEFFDSNDPGELPVSGTYTFQVTDPDGNVGTTQEVFTPNVIDNISEDTLQPSLKNPTEHFINATFDNVRINDALFEDFDSYGDIDDLDRSKWRPRYPYASILGQALQLDVHDIVGRTSGYLHFVDSAVSKVQADITVNSISVADGPPRARIGGYVFNDGLGDVYAFISVNGSRVFYTVGTEWLNEQDTYTWIDEFTDTLMPVTLGQTVTVSMEWTGNALIFCAWDPDNPGTVYEYSYVPNGPVYPPINHSLELAARIQLYTDSTTPTFRWGKVAGATRYMVRIYNYDRSRTLWTAVVGDVDSVTVPPGILKPNSYYRYRITARDGHNGLWIGLDEWDTDNLSRTPAHYGDYYIFYTGSQQAQAPFVDLDGGGVETWTSRELGGTFLSFWLKVHDAQGVPGNIDTVTVILPGGAKLPLYHDPDSPWNTPTAGIYRMHDFPKPAPEGTYTFTAVDKDGHVDTVTEELTREPVDSVDPTSISIAVSGTTVDIDWDEVTVSIPDFYAPVFYRAEIYDQDYNRIYAFCTTKSRFHVTEGLLAPGTLYRLQITARREFFEENVDNGSQSTWTYGDAWPTFTTEPLAGGIAAPTIDTANYGAAIQHNLNPNIADDVYLLIFEVDVTDADGVPGNIASVTVTYPDGTSTRELHLDKTLGENQGRYTDVVLYSDPLFIPEGTYTFTVTDAQGNWAQTSDALSLNVLPLPRNLAPADGALLDTTTPVFGWDPVSGAVSYRVQVNNGYSGLIHQSDYLAANNYLLPYGILQADRTYSYRVYAYRENYPAEDLDNFSTDLFFFSRWKHFRITADPDSDGDGVVDSADEFPADPGEWQDTDADGIGDNADADDDNDSMPDSWERAHGLPPMVYSAGNDADGDGIADLQEYMAGTLPDDDTSFPSSAATPGEYKGIWKGTGTIVLPHESFTDSVVMRYTVNGDTLTAVFSFGSDPLVAVSGELVNGVFFFEVPTSDAFNPDCANWDVQGLAMLDADLDSMHLTLAGTFCSAGGGSPGSFEAWLTRSAGGFGAHIPLLLLDE